MNKKIKNPLYYLFWIVGLIAVIALAYNIYLSLFGLIASIFVSINLIIIRRKWITSH